ncbi:MAG: hypothetical protein U0984_15960 [Prosthecobacter sp.]|nr:hypothetical protein [Prosthecobacter sp.]
MNRRRFHRLAAGTLLLGNDTTKIGGQCRRNLRHRGRWLFSPSYPGASAEPPAFFNLNLANRENVACLDFAKIRR